jgi:hypothetical protein
VAVKRTVPTLHDYVRATHAVGEAVEAAMVRYAETEGDDHGDADADEDDDAEDGGEEE